MAGAPNYPPPPAQPARTRTGWIVAVVVLGVALLTVAATAGVVWASQKSDISELEDSLRTAQQRVDVLTGEITARESTLEEREDDIDALEADLDDLEADLADARDSFSIASGCARRAMRAWTSTINDSFEATGFALLAAYSSDECEDFRRMVRDGGIELF